MCIRDRYQDCVAVNGIVETLIREQPGQYLWVHRRFKTRPEGDADLYQPFGVGRKKKKRKTKAVSVHGDTEGKTGAKEKQGQVL